MASTSQAERKKSKLSSDKEAEEVSAEVEALRQDLQNLSNTVSRMTHRQINRATDSATATAHQAEEAVRRNPIAAISIAVGLGFLFGLLTRRG